MKSLLLFFAINSTSLAIAEPSELEMLRAAKENQLTSLYLKQSDEAIDISNLSIIKAPGTGQLCTLTGTVNSCSMSFRILNSDGNTLMSGGIHYDGHSKKYIIFRVLEDAPRAESDFELFSKIPGQRN